MQSSATMVVGLALVLSAAGPVPGAAFEFGGLRSGMTPAQVIAAAPPGYELRMLPGSAAPFSSGALVKGSDFFAQISFCNGRLEHLIRNLDADVDWLPAVRAAVTARGQPRVLVESQPWSGPGGGDVHSLVLRWTDGETRYQLSISPEGRDGKGALRHSRGASESYYQIAGNPCAKP